MTSIRKYPRTRHLLDSRLQPGEEDSTAAGFAEIAGRHIVVEEKVDGANAAISFDSGGRLKLQSRGHYLTGGPRERHFALLKGWAATLRDTLWNAIGHRYIVYGEWLYAKHTIFYDALPHYFLEFDVLDAETDRFLATAQRRRLLDGLPIRSVPVLHEGPIAGPTALKALLGPSAFKTQAWRDRLAEAASAPPHDPVLVRRQTDPSALMEGLYIKIEEHGSVVDRFKYVRDDFLRVVIDFGLPLAIEADPAEPARERPMTPFDDLVPSPARPAIDWRTIEETFEWFRRLDGCPQDPVFHAEGDVQIHTRMVCEALVADPRWRDMEPESRASLFWAALLHDVAKPECTRLEAGGRVTSPGHSRRGQIAARRILWRMNLPFRQREQICHLITHHQIPFFLIERDRPQRRLHAISLQTRCDLLAILATADARGRVGPDLGRLLDNIALFSELARDEQCLAEPKQFASPHSRFLYFRKQERAADYEAYDDWPGRVTLLSGLPGSGKSTWIARNGGDAALVSLDDLRAELDVDPAGPQGAVIAAARERARAALRARRPLVWNATNISRDIRGPLIELFAAYRAKVTIVYLETGEADAAHRNSERASPVPAKAFARMLERWEPPDLTECHDLVICTT